MRALFVLLSLLACSAAAEIGKVHVIPTAPTNLTPVRITFAGRPIGAPAVRIDGSRIELRFIEPDPTVNGRPRQDTVLLGALPAGNYEVVVLLRDGTVVQQFPLRVRDVTTLPIIFPWIHDDAGATFEWRYLGIVPPRFRIEGKPVLFAARYGYVAIRPSEPLPLGLYDVEVTWPDGKTDVARNAVEVIASGGDYSPFGERMLFPIIFNGRVADGTEWRTSFDWESLDGQYLIRDGDYTPAPNGVFFEASPRHERRRRYYIRVQPDPPSGAWTQIPVVTETEFRPSMRIAGVPAGDGKRVTLRLYSVEPARITITADGFTRQVTTSGGSLMAPAFALVDLSHSLIGGGDLVLQGDAPFWAMTSSFDVETRELVIRTP